MDQHARRKSQIECTVLEWEIESGPFDHRDPRIGSPGFKPGIIIRLDTDRFNFKEISQRYEIMPPVTANLQNALQGKPFEHFSEQWFFFIGADQISVRIILAKF